MIILDGNIGETGRGAFLKRRERERDAEKFADFDGFSACELFYRRR